MPKRIVRDKWGNLIDLDELEKEQKENQRRKN
jgi:hypothetical protein